jgi:hypothetical protein
MAEIIEKKRQATIKRILELPDDIELWAQKGGLGHLTDIEGDDLKALATELASLRAEVEGYKRVIAVYAEDAALRAGEGK